MAAIKVTYGDLQRVFGQVKVIKLKGFSQSNRAENEKDKYQHAKHPLVKGWQSEENAALTAQEARDWINKKGWIGMLIPQGHIVVDVDDRDEGQLIHEILIRETIKHHAIRTPNGWQFTFKDSGTVSTQNAKVITWAGFVVDYRLQGRGQVVLPVEGSTLGREWITVCNDTLDEMPSWFNRLMLLQQGKTRPFTLPISEGGRNDTLFRHASRLQELGLSDDDITDTILFMGANVTDPAYEGHELHATLQSALNHPKGERGKKNEPSKGPQTVADTSNIPQHEVFGEWEEPDRFDEYKLPLFPVEVFPDWLSNFIRGVSESTQTPIDASCMPAIAALSTALAKKVVINPYGAYIEPVNTYTVVVLPPGNRKSAVFQLFQEPIYLYESSERKRAAPNVAEQAAVIDSEKKKLEKLKTDYSKNKDVGEEIRILAREIDELEEKQIHLPRFVTDDITQEKLVGLMSENGEKMANLSAEGGLFDIIAGRYSKGKPNLEIFLKGHAGDPCTVDRMGRTESMKAPALTLGLFIQPIVLNDIPSEFAGRGLMARFLYSLPFSNVGEREIRPNNIPERIQTEYKAAISKLLHYEPVETITLRLTAVSSEYLRSIEQSFEPRLSANGDLSNIVEWASKQIGQALRIVALLHVAEHIHLLPNLPSEISEPTMKRGLSLIEYFIPHTRKAFDCMEANAETENACYLWGKLKSLSIEKTFTQDYFTKQEVWRVVRGKFKTAERFDTAIKTLSERYYIRIIKDKNGEAGRNTNLIYLNPMAIMAKIVNKTNEKQKNSDYSHYSHDITHLKNENIDNPLQSNKELESLDVLI